MKLADYLKQNRINLADFGNKIGRSSATVSRLARGKQWPDRDTVLAIEKATDGSVTANDFAQSEAA